MNFTLVTPAKLPSASQFFLRAFGKDPEGILFFVGPVGTGWDSATFHGVLFHVASQQAYPPERRDFLKTFFPGRPLHALDVSSAPQSLQVERFIAVELLPALADVTAGAVVSGDELVYRANKHPEPRDHPIFDALWQERANFRRSPASAGEDWGDL